MSQNRNGLIHKESIFYAGISPDPFMGPEGSFQYSENLDIRNNLNGVELLPAETTRQTTIGLLTCYVKYDADTLVRIYDGGTVTIGDNSSFTETTIGTVGFFPLGATKFRGEVYVFGSSSIKRFGISGGAMTGLTDITPPGRNSPVFSPISGIPVINYWNAAILVGIGNKLRRGLPSSVDGPVPVGGRKEVRVFDKAEIRGLVGRSSNIEVYTNYNGLDSRIYYIGGFRDAEDTGISDTVVFENLSILQIGQLGERVFVICRDQTNSRTTYLYEVSGYNKRLMRKSTEDGGTSAYADDFDVGAMHQNAPTWGDMLFLPFHDGLWSYGRFEDYTPDALVRTYDGQTFWTGVCFGTALYCSSSSGGNYYETKYPLTHRVNSFTSNDGVLVSRIFTGGSIRTLKQLKRIRVGYEIDSTGWTSGSGLALGTIAVYVRMNRAGYNPDDNRTLVDTITDHTKMSHRIEPNQIQALGIEDFNVMERRVVILPGTYTATTPTFYDIEFEYDTIQD